MPKLRGNHRLKVLYRRWLVAILKAQPIMFDAEWHASDAAIGRIKKDLKKYYKMQNTPPTMQGVSKTVTEEVKERVIETKITSQQKGYLAPDTETLEFTDQAISLILDGYYALGTCVLTKNKHHFRVDDVSLDQLYALGFTFVYKATNAMTSIENSIKHKGSLYVDPITSEATTYVGGSIMKHPTRNIYVMLRNGNDINYGKYGEDEDTRLNKVLNLYDLFFAYTSQEDEEYLMDLAENVFVRRQHKREKKKGYLSLVISTPAGLALKEYPLNEIDIDFNKHYNEGFEEVHETIVEGLGETDSKGIVLLHGIKGSGKTSYIKYLTTLKDKIKKKFIFLPTDLTSRIATPGFIELLMNNPDSIMIIEDGENILKKRTGGDNGAVSTILNLGDGLLSDCLSIQFIITFNTQLKDIDDALTRKGRLITEYKFEELAADRAKLLVPEEHADEVTAPMTLADAINYTSKYGNRTAEAAAIGFGK